MKYDLRTTLLMMGLFFLAQIFGLYVIKSSLNYYGIESFQNDEAVSEALYSLPVSIIILSVIFIIFYKLKAKRLLLFWYAFAFVTCATVSLSVFINEFYALFIALSVLVLKLNSKDDYFHNMTELLVYGGIAVLILPMLSTFSAIILLIIISVYDFIAVRLSKHMITLAKTQFELNIFSGLKLNVNGSSAILGGGDIAFPLILAGAVLRDYSLIGSILVIYGALIGLLSLVLLGRENKFYPAMPFITIGCFLGLMLNSLFVL